MGDRRRSGTGGLFSKEEFLLPPVVDNVEDSVKFFCCCLTASTSVILHSRRLLPQKHFKMMSIQGLPSQILNPKDAVANRIIKKLQGVSSTLHKGFLKEFIIVVSDDRDNSDSVTELYTWEFSYLSSGTPTANFVDGNGNRIVSVSYRGSDHVKNQLKVLIAKLINLCQSVLQPVHEGCYPGLRVTYSDLRPAGYHAPGFEPSHTLYQLGKNVRSVPLLDDGMASKRHGAFVTVSSSFLPIESDAVVSAQINGKLVQGSFSDYDDNPQAFEKGDNVSNNDDSFLSFGSDHSDGDVEVTRQGARSSDSSPAMPNNLQLKKDLERGLAESPIYRHTNTSGSAELPNDDVFEESSLMTTRRTRSPDSDLSMFSSDLSAIQAKRGILCQSNSSSEKHTRPKRPRKSVRYASDSDDDFGMMSPVAEPPRRRTNKR